MVITLARKAGESMPDYRARRKSENAAIKRRLAPRLLWNSLGDKTRLGTYIRAEHGPLR